MKNKTVLLFVGIMTIGLFIMPNTLSLFAGQHTFDSGANVKCEKCHQDIYEELNGNGAFGVSTAHSGLTSLKECRGCHKTGTIGGIPVNKTDSDGIFIQNVGQKGAHAAVTMECAGCHTGVPTELLNTSEAHSPFYNAALGSKGDVGANSTILKGANEACVGCHTHTNINATWQRSVGMDLLVKEDTTGSYNITISVNNSYNQTTTKGGNVTLDGTY